MTSPSQYRDYYSRLADDELARIALSDHLVPEAQEALTAELQKRGITDLREYKRLLAEAAAASSPEAQMAYGQRMKEQFALWMLVPVAWMSAVALPWTVMAAPESIPASLALAFLTGLSCFLGRRARRRGGDTEYVLRFVFPLALLVISSVVALAVALGIVPP